MKKAVIGVILLLAATFCRAQYYQECGKLLAGDAAPKRYFGKSVALSANGQVAIVGSCAPLGDSGAAYIFTRGWCGWNQAAKLIGTGAAGAASQGFSVAISADGETAVVGAPDDDHGKGAVWVFINQNGTWAQQGGKLVGAGAVDTSYQGQAVAISADGNTLVEGAPGDNGSMGAAWVFTRSGANWAQVGAKLTGTGIISSASSPADLGFGVAISGDGNTIAVGAPGHNLAVGGVWIYTNTGGQWVQQIYFTGSTGYYLVGISASLSYDGNTLAFSEPVSPYYASMYVGGVAIAARTGTMWTNQAMVYGTGATGVAEQSGAVALSSSGDTLTFGGAANLYATTATNIGQGQIWTFTRTGSAWAQLGQKLVGTGYTGNAQQGCAVAISGDAQTIMTSGYADNDSTGAVWTYSTTQNTGIATAANPARFAKVYPNPAADVLYIRFETAISDDAIVTISDATGKAILVSHISKGTSEAGQDVSGLANGLYFITIQCGKKAIKEKFMKQ